MWGTGGESMEVISEGKMLTAISCLAFIHSSWSLFPLGLESPARVQGVWGVLRWLEMDYICCMNMLDDDSTGNERVTVVWHAITNTTMSS
jgi:hypothetical protein